MIFLLNFRMKIPPPVLLIHSQLYLHTHARIHIHTYIHERPNLETGKVSRGSQRGNDGRILAACLSSGRWKKGEENQWGFTARCCKPRAPLYHGPPRKIWKVHESPVCCIQTKYLRWKRLERGREGVGRRRDCTSFRYWTGARQGGKGLQGG